MNVPVFSGGGGCRYRRNELFSARPSITERGHILMTHDSAVLITRIIAVIPAAVLAVFVYALVRSGRAADGSSARIAFLDKEGNRVQLSGPKKTFLIVLTVVVLVSLFAAALLPFVST